MLSFSKWLPSALLAVVLACGGGKASNTSLPTPPTSPAPTTPPAPGSFRATGGLALGSGRTNHTATLLTFPQVAGKVLLAGGETFSAGSSPIVPTVSTEIYDPSTGTFHAAGPLAQARFSHMAVQLLDGRVLVAGGSNGSALASAELFNPATNLMTATGSMNAARTRASAVLLTTGPDAGKVLIIGGADASGTSLASLELFDPATGTFTVQGATMAAGRSGHTATPLGDGRILIAGGQSSTLVEIYDSATGSLTAAGRMLQERTNHTATLLPGSRILLAGGNAGGQLSGDELCDLSGPTPRFTAAAAMNLPRRDHAATLLPSGLVLIVGGSPQVDGSGGTSEAELFDPATLKFWPAGKQTDDYKLATATLLTNGQVLVAGGWEMIGEPSPEAFLYQ